MHMADWIGKLDAFLRLSERDILTHAGRISHQQAEEHAHAQYELHEREHRESEAATLSDFDDTAKRIAEQAAARPIRAAVRGRVRINEELIPTNPEHSSRIETACSSPPRQERRELPEYQSPWCCP